MEILITVAEEIIFRSWNVIFGCSWYCILVCRCQVGDAFCFVTSSLDFLRR